MQLCEKNATVIQATQLSCLFKDENFRRGYSSERISRVLVACVLFVATFSCKNDPAEIRALTGKSRQTEDHAKDVTVIYSKNGNVNMRIFAHDFVRNENSKRPYIDMNTNLRAEFYNDSGAILDVLTADSSRYYEAQGDMIIWDSVKIVTKKGEQLNTQELIWNASAQKFFTEKPVRISSPTEVIYGNGMEANSDFSWYQITNPRGTVQVNKGEVPQ